MNANLFHGLVQTHAFTHTTRETSSWLNHRSDISRRDGKDENKELP